MKNLKSVREPRPDDEITKARDRTGGEVAAFNINLDGKVGHRLDADAAGAAVNDIVTGDPVAAERLVADIAFQISIEEPVLVIERGEGAIGNIIVRIEKTAAALFLKVEQPKTVTDDDARTQTERVLGNQL